jgi:hypothetical protein
MLMIPTFGDRTLAYCCTLGEHLPVAAVTWNLLALARMNVLYEGHPSLLASAFPRSHFSLSWFESSPTLALMALFFSGRAHWFSSGRSGNGSVWTKSSLRG